MRDMAARVKDVMVRDVVTVDASAKALEALELMFEKSVKSLIVPPRSESDAYGIITLTDIARKALAHDEPLDMLNVYDLMTKPCLGVDEELDVRYAARMLTDHNISRAIVTEARQLKGIVSITDLVKSLVMKKG